MARSCTNMLAHIIFSTKERAPLIRPDLAPRLFAYLGGIVRELRGVALAINGTPDHVHVLARLPSTLSVADFLRVLKTNSARWVHENWPIHKSFGWQLGYGAFRVSESNVPAVSAYVAGQEEHHRKVSFQEEFLAHLKKNHIEVNERYLWN